MLNWLRNFLDQRQQQQQAPQQEPVMIRGRDEGQYVPLSAQRPAQDQPRRQNALPDLPGGWLNIFTAVRGYNQARMERANQIVNQELARNQDARAQAGDLRAQAGENREQVDWDTERASRTTFGALGAYSNMVDSIQNNTSIAEADRPQAYVAAFDRIAPALQAAGYDTARVEGLREQLVQNPDSASDLLAGLTQSNGGSQAAPVAAFDERTGRAVYLNPRTGRPTARGYAPASAVLGQERLGISQQNADTAGGNLAQRQRDNDPNHIFDENAARAEGAAAGEAAQGLPSARAAIARSTETVERILSSDPDTLQSILGVPSIGGLFRGGAGMFGSIPGSPSADLAADVEQALSQARLAAYESLRGGGHITEAESLFGAQAWTNLTRARSMPAFQDELRRFRGNLRRADEILQQTAAPSRNPSRNPSRQQPAAPRAAPAAGGINVDEYLSQRGW